MKTWIATQNTVEEALSLPEGSYVADFDGMLMEQTVRPHHVVTAVNALKENQIDTTFASQSAILVEAQKRQLAFQEWFPLKLL